MNDSPPDSLRFHVDKTTISLNFFTYDQAIKEFELIELYKWLNNEYGQLDSQLIVAKLHKSDTFGLNL